MNKIICIGEIIADSISTENKNYTNLGGAPLNVCVQIDKLGGAAMYLSKTGAGIYSENLLSQIRDTKINKDYIIKDPKCNTSIAYVFVDESGERKFSFLRNKAPEMNLSYHDYKNIEINEGDIFEFGSVALQSKKSRATHDKLLRLAKSRGAMIAFDPNLRFNLWNDDKMLKNIVLKYIKKVDILKISDDELRFIYNLKEADAIEKLFSFKIKLILLTRGKAGASLYAKDDLVFNNKGYEVDTIDTTGCGDSCFGGFLYQVLNKNENYQEMVDFACKCGALTSRSFGALNAMPTLEEIENYNFIVDDKIDKN